MLQPKKPVKKYVPTAKEKKNLKDATEMKNMRPTGPTSGRVKPTLGGAKNGKAIAKAKNGKSFPDLNKDGKVTKADVLKGRGVIAKNGKPVKKAAIGAALPIAMKALPMLSGMFGGKGKGAGMGVMGGLLGGLLGGKNGKTIKKSRSGGKMKKCKGGC
jgi:hypothetical protein